MLVLLFCDRIARKRRMVLWMARCQLGPGFAAVVDWDEKIRHDGYCY